MHHSTLAILIVSEIIALVILLPLRQHLLKLAGYQQGRVTKLVYTHSFNPRKAERILWITYKVITPSILLLVIIPISTVLFHIFHAPLVIVLTILILVSTVSYFYTDSYYEVVDKIDCASYKARHCKAHQRLALAESDVSTYYHPQPYKPQSLQDNIDAVSCRTHIH